ncbi:hypothetical protein [Alkalicoccus chagannorensis]|uniref:hypothetical protein n=1 Tax=Alkalicoccus chagannorensis TaxID=427072 RepID=UPI000408C6ED|nr:hypothetical protein [Alkalicoccus chagannorensis]
MKALRIVNIALAITAVLGFLYHFFVDDLPIPINGLFLYVSVMFVSLGLEKLGESRASLQGLLYVLMGMTAAVVVVIREVFL